MVFFFCLIVFPPKAPWNDLSLIYCQSSSKLLISFTHRPRTERPEWGGGAKPSFFTLHSAGSHGFSACVEGQFDVNPWHVVCSASQDKAGRVTGLIVDILLCSWGFMATSKGLWSCRSCCAVNDDLISGHFYISLLSNSSDHEETGKILSRILENVDASQVQKEPHLRLMQKYQKSENISSARQHTELSVFFVFNEIRNLQWSFFLHCCYSISTYRIRKD